MMYQMTIILFLFYTCLSQIIGKEPVSKLHLKSVNSIKQLNSSNEKRFDLSGMVMHKNAIYVIADKEWNNHIYKLDTSETTFSVQTIQDLRLKEKIDIEGIDILGDDFCFIDEWDNEIYSVLQWASDVKKIVIPWKENSINRSKWGNKGFEGLAVDNENDVLYLAKERQPRRIFKVDLKTKQISEPFAELINSEKNGDDIADMKYENNSLYILERGNGLVTKINVKTNEKNSLSFQHLVCKDGQRIYNNKHPEYGMAESLLLTKDEIWIGLDNNGDQVSEYGKSLGLKGNKPVILICERPKDF